MLPVIALVGRPNVGKSTLFNRLTRTRDALVADRPGLTRDRQYGIGKLGDRPYMVVDTGGFGGERDALSGLMRAQIMRAVHEADHVLFLVDAREGLTAADQAVGEALRPLAKPVTLVVNKIDGLRPDLAGADFFSLGVGAGAVIAAEHGRGVNALMDQVLARLPSGADEDALAQQAPGIRVAVIGRPNAGKSTLVNRILGQERVLAFDQPGTTRDSIFVPFERGERTYTLIDTAGVRRRARVREALEKLSVIKALQAVDRAHVTILVLDARTGVGEQDATLAGLVVDRGRALLLAVNKWDGLSGERREALRRELSFKLPFLDFAPRHFISALHGSGVGTLFDAVAVAHEAATRALPTPLLTRILEQAVLAHQPPLVRGRRVKLRYAHQGGRNPPVIVVHGNQTDALPQSYRQFLSNTFRRELDLQGTPVRIELRTGANPYQGKKNPLTERQARKRRRLMRHVKKK